MILFDKKLLFLRKQSYLWEMLMIEEFMKAFVEHLFKQEYKTNLRWECFASIKDQLYDMFALAMVCKIYSLSLW